MKMGGLRMIYIYPKGRRSYLLLEALITLRTLTPPLRTGSLPNPIKDCDRCLFSSTCISLPSHDFFLDATEESYNNDSPLALCRNNLHPDRCVACSVVKNTFHPRCRVPSYFTSCLRPLPVPPALVFPYFPMLFSWMQPRKPTIEILLLPSVKKNLHPDRCAACNVAKNTFHPKL